jgi:hypothetical protein
VAVSCFCVLELRHARHLERNRPGLLITNCACCVNTVCCVFLQTAQQPKIQPNPPNDMHPIAPQRRPFRPHFTYLYRLVLTRSRWPELAKANHFLAHLALMVGPEALSRPATAQNSLGRGRPPPLRLPPAPLRGARLGYAQPESSAFGGR